MCKVSIVVPIFGVERYIERCARSLFEQTLDDIEFIFVNDCTQDNSMEILYKIIDEYKPKNIKVINHSKNKGLPLARKSGITIATGEYIVNCDSDDWLEINYCQKLYDNAIATDADMVVCNYYISDDNGKRPACWALDNYYCTDPYAFKYYLSMMLSPAIWLKMIRREILQRNVFFYANSYSSEDWVMTVQSAFYSSKITYVDECLYNYYVGNRTNSRMPDVEIKIQNLKQDKENINLVCKWLSKMNLLHKYRSEIIRRKLWAKDNLLWQISPNDFHKIYRLWLLTFWTTNFAFIFNKYYTVSEKKRYIKHMIGRLM